MMIFANVDFARWNYEKCKEYRIGITKNAKSIGNKLWNW